MEPLTLILLILCLVIALGFEFVNGFHDTANAVATVIYTRSLKPTVAVIWSGLINFLGTMSVLGGGAAVAFKIVNLIPTDLLTSVNGPIGVWMILSILITAVFWNLLTWYLGIPASSSHTLIGSILGVGLAAGFLQGKGWGGLNADKAIETLQWLLYSPLIGFAAAGALYFVARMLLKKRPELFQAPEGDAPPPWPVRLLLIGTCTGVSYAHGSNDGQKGIGLLMLALIAFVPSQFTVNPNFRAPEIQKAIVQIHEARPLLEKTRYADAELAKKAEKAVSAMEKLEAKLVSAPTLSSLSVADQASVRTDILKINSTLKKVAKARETDKADGKIFDGLRETLSGATEFVAWWVIVLVALALGIGTTVGWKRVVITVGEKIGKSHMTYAQGATAELVAMIMILFATKIGAPVSTTHVVSSGIAGTMAASGAGVQFKTIRTLLIAWVLTLPVTILLSAGLFWLTAGRLLAK
jgi:inorganic phosphate transporter, PiT family